MLAASVALGRVVLQSVVLQSVALPSVALQFAALPFEELLFVALLFEELLCKELSLVWLPVIGLPHAGARCGLTLWRPPDHGDRGGARRATRRLPDPGGRELTGGGGYAGARTGRLMPAVLVRHRRARRPIGRPFRAALQVLRSARIVDTTRVLVLRWRLEGVLGAEPGSNVPRPGVGLARIDDGVGAEAPVARPTAETRPILVAAQCRVLPPGVRPEAGRPRGGR